MRWTIKVLLAGASLTLAVPPLGAQEGEEAPAPQPEEKAEAAPEQAPDMWSHVLERFDRNGDGALTKEDFEGMKAPAPRSRGLRGRAGPEGRAARTEDLRELARELFQDHPQLRQWFQQRRGQQRAPRAGRGQRGRFGGQGQMWDRGQGGPRGMGPGAWGPGQRGRGNMGPGKWGRGQRGPGRVGPGMQGRGGRCPHCGQPRMQRQGRGQQRFGQGFGPPPWAGR